MLVYGGIYQDQITLNFNLPRNQLPFTSRSPNFEQPPLASTSTDIDQLPSTPTPHDIYQPPLASTSSHPRRLLNDDVLEIIITHTLEMYLSTRQPLWLPSRYFQDTVDRHPLPIRYIPEMTSLDIFNKK